MGGGAASYFLSDPFAYWHQTCDIHQINRAVGVSPPRPQLPWHKASSEMFINITLFPMNESRVPSERAAVHTWTGELEHSPPLCSEFAWQRGRNTRWLRTGVFRWALPGEHPRTDDVLLKVADDGRPTAKWTLHLLKVVQRSFCTRLQRFLTGSQGYKNKIEMRLKCQMDFPSRKSVRMLQGEEARGKTCSL